jgi:hypothetical protein
MHRSLQLRWLLMLVLLWQGVAAASMVPQMRMTMAPVAFMPPCHMTGMTEEAAPRPQHVVLESCCDHPDCAVVGLCAACMPPMQASIPPLQRLGKEVVPQPVVETVAAPASHPFRPPIL